MEKGDKVKVLPNKKVGIVDRVEDGFIFLEGSNRPYMRGQLDYVKSIYDENKILQQAREVYKKRESEFYLETIRKTADELEKALERAKKVEEFMQKLVDDEDTPVWMKVYINNFIEEKLK